MFALKTKIEIKAKTTQNKSPDSIHATTTDKSVLIYEQKENFVIKFVF